MSRRWIPLIATTAALALAAVAGAQDRRDDRDHRDRSSKSSSDRPSRSRSDRDSRDTSTPRTRTDDRRSGDDRRSRDDNRSSTPDRTRPGSDSAGRSDRNNPFDRSGSRDNRSTPNSPSRPGDRTGDRPADRKEDNRPSDPGRPTSGGDRTDRRSDRPNPFDRRDPSRDDRRGSNPPMRRDEGPLHGGNSGRPDLDRRGDYGRRNDSPTNARGRAVLGVPVHERGPSYWDGRGHAPAARYGPAPVHSVLGIQINRGGAYRGTEVAIGAQIGGLRVGYVSYSDPGYRRSSNWSVGFGYSHYCYDPYVPGAVVVASPWYRYSYLPPYLDRSNVIVVNDYPAWNWDSWRRYDYESSRDNLAARDSVDDLRDAFEQGNTRVANRLVPEYGNVAIFNEGHYDYSLNPDDFQKMFLDGVEKSQTVRYAIEEVRTRGDEVRIRARHEYTDSWGETQSVIHTITLRRENGGDYVIREFGSE